MDKIVFLMLAACVFLMNTQYSIPIPIGEKQAIHLSIVDVLLWATFGMWIVSTIMKRSILKIKFPPLASLALPVVTVASAVCMIRAGMMGITDPAKELIQIVEYFIIASVLFVNVAQTRTSLRGLVSVFLFAVSAVILWGLLDYTFQPDAFKVGGAHANMNVLGTYLGLTVPFILGVALFDDLRLWQRVSLIVPALAGLVITLSGAALAATLASVLLLLALRNRKVLLPIGVAVLVPAIIFLPGYLRHDHKNVVASSVAVYVDNNYLLGDDSLLERATNLVERARRLAEEAKQRSDKESNAGNADYAGARRILVQLEAEGKLSEEGTKLLAEADEKLADVKLGDSTLPTDANGNAEAVVAMRYKCWQASLRTVLDHPWGVGPGKFQKAIGPYYGRTLEFNYNGDEPEVYNLGFPEPDTYNQFLVTAVEIGVPGLLAFLWFYLWGLSRAINLYATTSCYFSQGIAAGAMASLAFFPVLAAYSEILVRGVALPFIFIVLCAYLAEKTEKEAV